MVSTGPWRTRLRGLRFYQLHRGHPQGRENPLEALWTPGALVAVLGPEAPRPAAAGKGQGCHGASPKPKACALPCPPTLSLSHLKVPGGHGSQLTLLRPRAPGWVQPSNLPSLAPSGERKRNNFNLGKSLFPLSLPLRSFSF